MIEEFAWQFFMKTGNIDGYLLYKQSMNSKEICDEYGTDQDKRDCHPADQGQR